MWFIWDSLSNHLPITNHFCHFYVNQFLFVAVFLNEWTPRAHSQPGYETFLFIFFSWFLSHDSKQTPSPSRWGNWTLGRKSYMISLNIWKHLQTLQLPRADIQPTYTHSLLTTAKRNSSDLHDVGKEFWRKRELCEWGVKHKHVIRVNHERPHPPRRRTLQVAQWTWGSHAMNAAFQATDGLSVFLCVCVFF